MTPSERTVESATDEHTRAAAFRARVEAQCEAVRDEARRATEKAKELFERYESSGATASEERATQVETRPEAPPVMPVERSGVARSMSADAEELVRALLQSRREREEQETTAERVGSDNDVASPDPLNHGFEQAQLRAELEKVRGEVIVERLKLEALKRETKDALAARVAVTSNDEDKDVENKINSTRTRLSLLEDEEARLAENLEYQQKNSACVRKACQEEEKRLRKHLDEVRAEVENETAHMQRLKSDTQVAANILEEHESYIEKVRSELGELERAVESKSAMLRELDGDQSTLEQELEEVRAQLDQQRELGKQLLEQEQQARDTAEKATEALKTEVEQLKEEKIRCEADIEKSQEALAEAVQLLQLAKETAEREMSWNMMNAVTPQSSCQVSRLRSDIFDSAHNTPHQSPIMDVRGRRLFDDSPTPASEEEKAYYRLMMIEKAAKDADVRRTASETAAQNAEIRLRRMVDFMNRVGRSPSATTCSTPSRPASPLCMDYPIYQCSQTASVINSLESLRTQLNFRAKQSDAQSEQKASWRAASTPREELRSKLDQLVAEIRRAR